MIRVLPFRPRLEHTLERIRSVSEVSESGWLELLELTQSQYQDLLLKRIPITARMVSRVAVHFGMSFESVITGKIDYAVLSAQAHGNVQAIPERFRLGSHSKTRSALQFLNFVELNHGGLTISRILRSFQMNEASFTDPDQLININFLTELCEYLARSGCSTETFKAMGEHSFHAMKSSQLGALLTRCKSPRVLHEKIFTEWVETHFDQVYRYRLIELSGLHCVVAARLNPEMQDALKQLKIGSYEVCQSKVGSFQALAGHLGIPFSQVTEQCCIHRGASECRFHFAFSVPSSGSSKFLSA